MTQDFDYLTYMIIQDDDHKVSGETYDTLCLKRTLRRRIVFTTMIRIIYIYIYIYIF